MREILVFALMATGTAFMLMAALGMLRMLDLYMRLSACTKAATLGVSLMILGAAVHFDSVSVTSRAVLTILFVLLTAPVAGHMIGRAAYISGTPLWRDTIINELKGRYEPKKSILHSEPWTESDDDEEPDNYTI